MRQSWEDLSPKNIAPQLEEVFSHFILYSQRGWAAYLFGFEFSYNNHTKKATKMTPFLLEYRQRSLRITDVLLHKEIQTTLEPTDELLERTTYGTEMAKSTIIESNLRMIENVEKK